MTEPQTILYKGKPLEDYSKCELIEIITFLLNKFDREFLEHRKEVSFMRKLRRGE